MRSTASLVSAALLCACGAFADAAAPGADAGPADGDAAVADAAVPDGASGSFCAVHAAATFCTDFEDATTFPFGFDDEYLEPGPSLELVTDRGASGPRSLRLRADLSGDVGSWLRKELPSVSAGRARYELSFAFSVAASTTSYAVVGAIWFVDSDTASIHGLSLRGQGMAGGSVPSTERRAIGEAWHRARITLTRDDANTYTRAVTIDGELTGSANDIDLTGLDVVDIRLGAYFVEKAEGSLDISFDDVVVSVSDD